MSCSVAAILQVSISLTFKLLAASCMLLMGRHIETFTHHHSSSWQSSKQSSTQQQHSTLSFLPPQPCHTAAAEREGVGGHTHPYLDRVTNITEAEQQLAAPAKSLRLHDVTSSRVLSCSHTIRTYCAALLCTRLFLGTL